IVKSIPNSVAAKMAERINPLTLFPERLVMYSNFIFSPSFHYFLKPFHCTACSVFLAAKFIGIPAHLVILLRRHFNRFLQFISEHFIISRFYQIAAFPIIHLLWYGSNSKCNDWTGIFIGVYDNSRL